jgi:hypothetical protein
MDATHHRSEMAMPLARSTISEFKIRKLKLSSQKKMTELKSMAETHKLWSQINRQKMLFNKSGFQIRSNFEKKD